MKRAVVVGSSIAGLRAAEGLVRGGYPGVVTVVDPDLNAPYDRTALSKDLLTGIRDVDDVRLPVPDAVELGLGVEAIGLDVGAMVLETTSGRLPYDDLVLATGGHAVCPEAWRDVSGVHTLRSLPDAQSIRAELVRASHVVVVGGGVLGLEIATSVAAVGRSVEVVELADVPLARVLPPVLSRHLAERARAYGVVLHCSVGVRTLVGNSRVEAVVLTDGTLVPADVVLVAIGSRPSSGWLAGSGLVDEHGIVCDPFLRAGPRGIYAVGDLARVVGPSGRAERCEHWTRAAEHGAYVARVILGTTTQPFDTLSYAWSDLAGIRLQVLGDVHGDRQVVVRSAADPDRMAVVSARDGVVRGVATIGWQRLAMTLRSRIQCRSPLDDVLGTLPPEACSEPIPA